LQNTALRIFAKMAKLQGYFTRFLIKRIGVFP
jgi:hypothetical protein